jgi:hypothetical protein
MTGREVVYPLRYLAGTAKMAIKTENGSAAHRVFSEEGWWTPHQPQGWKWGELGGKFVLRQDAIGLISHDVVRGDHFDWLEAESAAGGKEAGAPLGLGTMGMVRKGILYSYAHRLPLIE